MSTVQVADEPLIPCILNTCPRRYSYALFLPTIVADLGYENTTAQLLSVPPYFVACFFCIGAGWLADKWKQRGVVMICCMCIA